MTDYALALQGAIFAALKTAGVAGGRVYDSIPSTAVFPYVSFGPADAVADDADCIEAVVLTQQIDVWSRAAGFPQLKGVAAAARSAIHRVELPMTGARLVDIAVRQIRYLRDPDGETSHAVIEVRALIEPE